MSFKQACNNAKKGCKSKGKSSGKGFSSAASNAKKKGC